MPFGLRIIYIIVAHKALKSIKSTRIHAKALLRYTQLYDEEGWFSTKFEVTI